MQFIRRLFYGVKLVLLGGSWVIISEVISRVIVII